MPFSQKLSQILFPCGEAERTAENGREFSGISALLFFICRKIRFFPR